MAMTERSRWELREKLKGPLGMATANALMEHLPPPGADLVTNRDLDQRLDATKHEIVSTMTWRMVGFFGVTFAAMFGGFAGLVATLH
jgi:hypothetical protein